MKLNSQRAALLLFLLFPYFILNFYTEVDYQLDWARAGSVFFNSAGQAIVSTIAILVFGYIGALGLIGIRSAKWRGIAQALALLPNFVPSLVVIMSVFIVWEQTGIEIHFGFWPVVIVHSLLNIGLCAVLWMRLIVQRLGGPLELAIIEGSSRIRLSRMIWGISRNEILLMGFGFFSLCFTSFAIPLVLGGASGATIEVYAYELIAQQSNVGGALILGALQWIFFGIAMYFTSNESNLNQKAWNQLQSLGHSFGLIIISISFATCCLGMFIGFISGFRDFISNPILLYGLIPVLRNSAVITVSVAIYMIMFFYLTAYASLDAWALRILSTYSAPSAVLMGLGFYLLPLPVFSKLSFGLAFLYFPFLLRFQAIGFLKSLNGQIETARVLGANSFEIIRSIVWPQFRPTVLFLAGLGALWASGDFAFSSVVTGEISNLALTAKSLLGSYHFELALIYVWFSFAVGLFVFLLLLGLSYVADQKFIR